MRTTLTVTTEPEGEPTTVELVKQHCRIDSNADDELLAGYLTTARIMAEDYLSRSLLTSDDPLDGAAVIHAAHGTKPFARNAAIAARARAVDRGRDDAG